MGMSGVNGALASIFSKLAFLSFSRDCPVKMQISQDCVLPHDGDQRDASKISSSTFLGILSVLNFLILRLSLCVDKFHISLLMLALYFISSDLLCSSGRSISKYIFYNHCQEKLR
jgi:hypothetical protein